MVKGEMRVACRMKLSREVERRSAASFVTCVRSGSGMVGVREYHKINKQMRAESGRAYQAGCAETEGFHVDRGIMSRGYEW
jgi:hypothetical protein